MQDCSLTAIQYSSTLTACQLRIVTFTMNAPATKSAGGISWIVNAPEIGGHAAFAEHLR